MTNEAKKKVDKALDALGEIIDTAHQAKIDTKKHVTNIKKAGKLFGEALDELFKDDTGATEPARVEITINESQERNRKG